MSNIPKDKFLKELDEYQEKNGMRGAKRYSDAEVKRWKEKKPLTEEQLAKLKKRENTGFIFLMLGVSFLFFGAIVYMILQ